MDEPAGLFAAPPPAFGPVRVGDTVSVVVPVHDRAHLVGRALDCLTRQTYAALEILVVDDGSTDDLPAALARHDDPRIRLIRRDRNGGAAAARNAGLAAATGRLIAFHDSDDICAVDRIARGVALLASLPDHYAGIHSPMIRYWVETPETYRRTRHYIFPPPGAPVTGDMEAAAETGNPIHLTTMLLRREAVARAGPFDPLLRNNEDWDFTIRLAGTGPFGFVPEPLYFTVVQVPSGGPGGHISGNRRYSAQSYVRIAGKMKRQGRRPAVLAQHYRNAARLLLRVGRPSAARRFARAALACDPRLAPAWALWAASRAPALYRAYARRTG